MEEAPVQGLRSKCVGRVPTSIAVVALQVKETPSTVAPRLREAVAIRSAVGLHAPDQIAILALAQTSLKEFWTQMCPVEMVSSVNNPITGKIKGLCLALALIAVVCSGPIGCNPARTAAKERLDLLTKTLVAGRWKDLGPFIASGESEGYAMNPSELAQFLQEYADCESRHVVIRQYFPGHIPSTMADSSSKVTVYVRTEGPGLSPIAVALVARHAGDGVWLIRERDILGSFLGILHPNFDERYRCIRAALLKLHLPRYGNRGHYTTPERIQAFLDHKLERNRLYSANPEANPVTVPTSLGGK
jgi:hypothetical protein